MASVSELFAAADVSHSGVVRWGSSVPASRPGVYCIATTADPHAVIDNTTHYRPSTEALECLLKARQHLSIQGVPATPEALAERLGHFWIPNQPVLYIGKAGTSLRSRVGQYYSTKLGARTPHSGGWWLKTLDALDELYVHFAVCPDPGIVEQLMLKTFAERITEDVRRCLLDTERIAPFANVETELRQYKRHGLQYYKSDPPAEFVSDAASPLLDELHAASGSTSVTHTSPSSDGMRSVWSLPLTEKDLTRSSLRIPAASKHAFPSGPTQVPVVVDGQPRTVAWNPNGSRSGLLGVGKATMLKLGPPGERVEIGIIGAVYTFNARRVEFKTLGVDLAASPKKTAMCLIEWTAQGARVHHIQLGAEDSDIVHGVGSAQMTGIDCPLGWPKALVPFLTGVESSDPTAVLPFDGLAGRDRLAYRETDRFVREKTGLRPLSVAADRLAHAAMRCAVIQAKIAGEYGVQPKDGSGRIAEVYPAASLRLWQMAGSKYKGKTTAESSALSALVDQLLASAPWLDLGNHEESIRTSDDVFDAVIASITAHAVATGSTAAPQDEARESARLEGWIHLPQTSLAEQLSTGVAGGPGSRRRPHSQHD